MSSSTDSKFKNLPGIASDQPDVYETSDLPESDQSKPIEERFESEHIEKTNINVTSAFHSFRGKSLIADNADFSDSIVIRQKRGYGTSPTVISIGAIGATEPETMEEKYNRLQLEIKELAEALQDFKKTAEKSDVGSSPNLSVDSIVALQCQLKELQAEQILGPSAHFHIADPQGQGMSSLIGKVEGLKKRAATPADAKKHPGAKDNESGRLTYELFPSGTSAASGQTVKTADLESRLSKLEAVLGVNDEKNMAEIRSGGKNVVEVVQAVSDKVKLLDLNHLDLVEARLNVLQQKLSGISEKKQSLDVDSVAKVNEVYEMMSKWNAYCATLPQLVARMRSLSELHEQALQFSQALTQLDTVQQQLSKSLEVDSSLLNDVRTGLSENAEIIKNQCEAMDKRIKSLTK